MLKYLRILVIVMGVVSLVFCLVLGLWLFFVGWLVLGFWEFLRCGGHGKVCIRKR